MAPDPKPPPHSSTASDSRDARQIEAHRLFLERQRLIRAFLETREPQVSEVKKEYLRIRRCEEEILLEELTQENAQRSEPKVFERSRKNREKSSPRLRIWINILIITMLVAILFMFVWEPKEERTPSSGSTVPPLNQQPLNSQPPGE